MLKIFQTITKKLSIKAIVLLGVYVMALTVLAFALTMTYLTSTIKYDQDTLKDILNLEQKNQRIINIIKNINSIDNKLLVSTNIKQIDALEKTLLSQSNFENLDKTDDILVVFDSYNSQIKNIVELLNKRIEVQNSSFESKSIILFFKQEINGYKNKINKETKAIANETESIYGKASLLTKRYNRKIKKGTMKLSEIQSLSLELSKIMTISKDLDSSILKLPNYLNQITNASNKDIINSINSNNLFQLITLFEDSLIKVWSIDYAYTHLEESVERINVDFTRIKELITFIITVKKQILKEEKNFKLLRDDSEKLNLQIFDNVNKLNLISNDIKFNILNHSDKVSKRTTTTVSIVGMVFLLLIFFAALTLISRINMPLEFILKYIDGIISKKKNLNSNLPITTDDEFGKLSSSFNNMTSTINNNILEIEGLNKEIEDTQKEVIFTMGSIGESRSKETGNHVKRVAEYSKILAIKYGLSMQEAELLKEASPMHDIGKVGIPDSILKKPEELNSQEWKIMKTHAQLGFEMLQHSNRKILKAAAIVAHEHHEKWDGSGYPKGLKKDEIHIYGRITALADVFDALGSDRCYKKAWEMNSIIKYFNDNKGKHFDPSLVELFLENIDEFIFVRDKYKDVFKEDIT